MNAQMIRELEQTRKPVAELKYKQIEEALHNLIDIIQFTEQVSTKMHGLVNEAEIYRTVKEDFGLSKQYTASILLLANDGSSLRIVETSLSPEKLKAGEKAAGLRMKGYKIDLKKSSIYRQVVREGKTVQVNVSDIIGELFPRPLAHLISKTVGYEKKPCVLTPLMQHGKIIGALAMTSPELAEYFIPSVINLAGHISNALEWANEYRERKRAEEALRENEERYRTLLESITDGVQVQDRELRYLLVNDELARMAQMPKEKLLGSKMTDLLPGVEKTVFYKTYEQVMETGEPAVTSDEFVFPDGRRCWYEVHAYPAPEGILVIVTDITERKKAEEKIREQYEFLENVLESLIYPFYVLDVQDYSILKANSAAGFSPGVTGGKCHVLTHHLEEPCDDPEHPCPIKEVLRTKKPVVLEHIRYDKDGNARNVEVHGFPLFDVNGNIIQMIKNSLDITERKQAEEALRESEERFRQFFENEPGYCYMISPEGIMLNVNTAALNALGYQKEELVGKSLKTIYAPEALPRIRQLFEKWQETGELKDEEITIITKGGDRREVLLSAGVVRGSDGKGLHSVSVQKDITERKRAEEELNESHMQLRNLSIYLQSVREEERGRIAREIHDELGQDLTAIKMDLSWLMSKLGKDQQKLREKTSVMNGLVDSMIQTVKRITSELRPPMLDDLGITAALEWEVGEFRKHTGITCELVIEPTEVKLDPTRSTAVYRIFQEALTNIARHAQATAVDAKLRAGPAKLELVIRDNGVGITEEQLQSPESFGLIGIRERAIKFGGGAQIMSIVGEGTAVSVEIPLEKSEVHHD